MEFTVFLPSYAQDPALHCGVPAGTLSCLLRLLLLQFHDGRATNAAYLLGLPHFADGPQVHNWKGEGSVRFVGPATLDKLPKLPPLRGSNSLRNYGGAPGVAGTSLCREAVLRAQRTWNNPSYPFPQQVEDERSDREETESSEGEEAVAGGAKSRPLANGHPILNNHRKND